MSTSSRRPSSLPWPHRARLVVASGALMLCCVQGAATAADPKPVAAVGAKGAVGKEAAWVKIDRAWVLPTVKGQTASGGYMTLTASKDLTLVGFVAAVAGETELHEMVMDGDVMRMRAIDSLVLPAGQTVALKPGAGNKHLMLMGLKQVLKEGDEVKLQLKLRTSDGKTVMQDVAVPVKSAQKAHAGGAHEHKHDHDHHHHNH